MILFLLVCSFAYGCGLVMAAPQAGQVMAVQGLPGVWGAVWPHWGQTHTS
jgi:hypothetical protein